CSKYTRPNKDSIPKRDLVDRLAKSKLTQHLFAQTIRRSSGSSGPRREQADFSARWRRNEPCHRLRNGSKGRQTVPIGNRKARAGKRIRANCESRVGDVTRWRRA